MEQTGYQSMSVERAEAWARTLGFPEALFGQRLPRK
jgi:hypothetical protein